MVANRFIILVDSFDFNFRIDEILPNCNLFCRFFNVLFSVFTSWFWSLSVTFRSFFVAFGLVWSLLVVVNRLLSLLVTFDHFW